MKILLSNLFGPYSGWDFQISAKSREYFGLKKWPLSEGRKEISQYI